jgi:predicted site-specific integrase-resolvase
MKIAIYSRVSTLKQDTENQLVQLREFAAKQGWEVTREYVDYESGAKADRGRVPTDVHRRVQSAGSISCSFGRWTGCRAKASSKRCNT